MLSFENRNHPLYISYERRRLSTRAFCRFCFSSASIGASGSLYGLMLFLTVDRLVAIKTNTDRRLFILMQLILLVLLPIIGSILLILMLKLNVAHSAHFGGGLVGFLFGVGMFGSPLPWHNEHLTCRTICRRTAFVFLFLYFVINLTIFFLIDAPVVDSILHNF